MCSCRQATTAVEADDACALAAIWARFPEASDKTTWLLKSYSLSLTLRTSMQEMRNPMDDSRPLGSRHSKYESSLSRLQRQVTVVLTIDVKVINLV
jgi:hypothetical protein